MFTPDTILQRTEDGRNEIYEKKQGLTQSERLVLIMIDGVSPCRDIRSKLPVLTEERLHRALTTLYNKDLIGEILLPLAGQEAEEIERTAVERFLQQDPLDPVTIISLNPEEDFGIPIASPGVMSPPQTQQAQQAFSRPDTTWYATTSAFAPDTQSLAASRIAAPVEAVGVEGGYSTLERAMAELESPNGAPHTGLSAMQDAYGEEAPPAAGWKRLVPDRQGVYLLIGFSLVFIGGFLLGRATG